MLRTVLMVSAYTAVVTIIFYLAAYSRLYNWWKNRLGVVMNGSLIATALIALGVAIRFADDEIGRIISITGWIGFSIMLMWRLGILLTSARERREKLQDEYDEYRKTNREDSI